MLRGVSGFLMEGVNRKLQRWCLEVMLNTLTRWSGARVSPPSFIGASRSRAWSWTSHTQATRTHFHFRHTSSQVPVTQTLLWAHWAPLKGSRFETDTPTGCGAKQKAVCVSIVCACATFSNTSSKFFQLPSTLILLAFRTHSVSSPSLHVAANPDVYFRSLPASPQDATFPRSSTCQRACVCACANV